MDSVLRTRARFGQRALLLTTAAVPLTGWAVHAVALHRRLAAAKRAPLTGLLRRDAYTARARQVLRRHGGDTPWSWSTPTMLTGLREDSSVCRASR
ncbi:hypothetical protein [Streptomyces sp. NPDC006307]|uniref:hypothetical protein n=1 Tax=Streptomyces sp. NPDC006307 TaxID=3156748 RepID=UPI0033A8787A